MNDNAQSEPQAQPDEKVVSQVDSVADAAWNRAQRVAQDVQRSFSDRHRDVDAIFREAAMPMALAASDALGKLEQEAAALEAQLSGPPPVTGENAAALAHLHSIYQPQDSIHLTTELEQAITAGDKLRTQALYEILQQRLAGEQNNPTRRGFLLGNHKTHQLLTDARAMLVTKEQAQAAQRLAVVKATEQAVKARLQYHKDRIQATKLDYHENQLVVDPKFEEMERLNREYLQRRGSPTAEDAQQWVAKNRIRNLF